ncbi:MAG: ABC transporter ATP-binding protein [Candidatus Hodarchaeales archaeon]|jgi:putative ABC transport system ATP-binding protein
MGDAAAPDEGEVSPSDVDMKDTSKSDLEIARTEETVVVAVKDVMKIYRSAEIDTAALRGVSLSIHGGEIVCVIGPSGSGKTTLVNVIGGVTRPDSGTVYWAANKRDISRLTEREITEARRRFIGFVFQTENLLPHLTAVQNVEMSARLIGMPRGERRKRSHELMELIGVDHRKNFLPKKLSGGEKQRVAIAAALMNQPQLILADEPTGNVDPETGEGILNLFRELNKTYGTAFLIVTHSQQVASKADRTIEIRDGIISGSHAVGVVLRDLESSRILTLDSQNRLPLPKAILDNIGSPRHFRAETAETRIMLTPRQEGEVDVLPAVSMLTCRVCGSLVPITKTYCPECGSAV